MKKSLIVVESPAKTKTIGKFLGEDFIAKSSYGHVRDLPRKSMGLDLEDNFKPSYEIIPGKAKTIKEIKAAARKAETIYLATDPDREGEAISWHLAEILKEPAKIKRAVFYEVTKEKVLEAIKHPISIDKSKVLAQQARRILDRIVGYMISPILWRKVGRGLSAGRVQSVAMRLILEREEKIKGFIPEEHWTIIVRLKDRKGVDFEAKLSEINGKKAEMKNEPEAQKIVGDLKGSARCQEFVVAAIKKSDQRRNPPPPFTTSLLQQEAARKLGLTTYRTMRLAQELYEGLEIGEEGPVGLITYMRTDSFRINQEFQDETRSYLSHRFGEGFVPERPNYFPPRKTAQEAHEAIRPTSLKRSPELIKAYLRLDQWKLYNLIWCRFLASQMSAAIIQETVISIEAGPYLFKAYGSVPKFSGFLAVYEEGKEEEEKEEGQEKLPVLSEREKLTLVETKPEQHFTKPPPPYSEAMLVKALEEEGIGRPSTYAVIIHTIEEREYVRRVKRKLYPTELGLTVTRLLLDSFPRIMDFKFTANLETQLDTIEEGKADWVEVVEQFYKPFVESLKKAEKEMRDLKHEKIATEVKCLRCGQPMILRWGRHGKFLACSVYPKCRYTANLDDQGEVKSAEVKSEVKCKKCGSPLLIKTGRFGRFLACSRYPDCKFTQGMGVGVKCPQENCGGEIVEKRSKKGRLFYACSNFPRCRFVSWHKPVLKPCPLCGAAYLVEKKVKEEGIVIGCAKEGCVYKEER